MRKLLLISFIISSLVFVVIFLFLNFNKAKFVSLENDKFSLNNKPFYPKVVNMMISSRVDESGIWACSYVGYSSNEKISYANRNLSKDELKSDLKLIKKLGFNCVRIIGIGEYNYNEKKNGELSIISIMKNSKGTSISLDSKKNKESYFNALEELFDLIDEVGLKAIFLVRMRSDFVSTENMLKQLTNEFGDHSAIFAYDLFNEPLYQDLKVRTKEDVYYAVRRWDSIVKANSNHQLTTIGLEGVREVFEWDPNILNVDFISYHPYEYELEQVRNELYWYGKYTEKPWIVGETAIPADNDSISYIKQAYFAKKTMKQAFNCGAIGYSWWQYKEVNWFRYYPNYLGLVTRSNKIKPAAYEIGKFDPSVKKKECLCLNNYYNYSACEDFKLSGRLVDENNKPIEGGIIIAWDENWVKTFHTISKSDGSFDLYSNFPFYHWSVTATKRNTLYGAINNDPHVLMNDSIPKLNIGTHVLNKLSFLSPKKL